jgi:hypothetical protein
MAISVKSSRHGTVVEGQDRTVAVGARGAAVKGDDGEEGAAAVGRYGGVVVGDRYESHEAWRAAAGVATGIAIGTMLARPPTNSTTVVFSDSSYMYSDGAYYSRVVSGGSVAYQVVAAPAGAIIATLPAGCASVNVGGVAYTKCGDTHYQRVANGYQVVVLH